MKISTKYLDRLLGVPGMGTILLLYIGSAVFLLVFAQLHGNSMMASDGGMYFKWSKTLFSGDNLFLLRAWVPLYPLVLWITGVITFQSLNGPAVLFLTNLIFSVLSILVLQKILNIIAPKYARLGVAFFAFFPITGFDFSFIPRADKMAIFVLLVSILLYLREKWRLLPVLLAMGLLTQKAIWLSLIILCLFWLSRDPRARFVCWLVPLPLIAYWIFGLSVGAESLVSLDRFSEINIQGSGGFLAGRGVVEGVTSESPAKVGKAIFVGAIGIFSLITSLLALFRMSDRRFQIALVVSLPLGIAAFLLNDHELLAVARYAPPLAIAATIVLSTFSNIEKFRSDRGLWRHWLVLILMAAVANISHLYFLLEVKLPLLGVN